VKAQGGRLEADARFSFLIFGSGTGILPVNDLISSEELDRLEAYPTPELFHLPASIFGR
jgi:hypothetical protein